VTSPTTGPTTGPVTPGMVGRILAAAVCAGVSLGCLASPAGWVYLAGEVLLATAVGLLVVPGMRRAER